jgi:hypothetical protein
LSIYLSKRNKAQKSGKGHAPFTVRIAQNIGSDGVDADENVLSADTCAGGVITLSMAITIKISRLEPPASVSVSIKVEESAQPIEFKNSSMASIQDMNVPVDPQIPYLTYSAIESACISGAIYSRRKLGVVGLKVELLSFSWEGEVVNTDPFAKATMIAAVRGFNKEVLISKDELEGWSEC